MEKYSCIVLCLVRLCNLTKDNTFKFLDDTFNPLPNDKILTLSKLKAFIDDKINVTPNEKFISNMEENIMGNREKTGCWPFLLFPQCLQKALFF